jgi:hypothetical protein
MAILYDSTFNRFAAQNLFEPDVFSDEFVVTLHSGTQPSDADFISNWGTAHYYNTSDDTVGTSVLGYYGANTSQTGNSANTLTFSQTSGTGDSASNPFTWVLNDTDFVKNYKADGTGAWAVIWHAADFRAATQSAFSYDDRYIICPVTDSSGTGAIKISSTTVSGSLPDFNDVSLDVTIV